MGTTTGVFTGNSNFSQDFSNVISRATAIASLPIKQLTADKAGLTAQATALTSLDGKFSALQTSLQGIANALSGSSFQADISDPSKAQVTFGAGAMEGNYTVDVVDAGTYATSMTSSNWVAGTGPTRSYQLSLGGVNYSVSPADNGAASVASAINFQYGDKVQATVVNVGSGTQADYRISLRSAQLGDLKPGLLVGALVPASLQAQQTSGSNTLASSQTALTWDANPALTYQLSLNGVTHSLTVADNSAQSIAAAITSQYGDQVTAAAVNLGTTELPDFRISLTAVKPGNVLPDLMVSDGIATPASVQTQQAAGSDTLATSRTALTWVAASGPTLSYQLSIGGVKYSVLPADNSAAGLVSAINTQQGGKVTAALVNLGTILAPDYRISLTAVQPGDLQPDILAGSTNVQQQQATGAAAHYIVNNSGLDVTSTTRSVTIANGVTVNLLAKDLGAPVNITVTRSTSALSDALTAFTSAYNAAVDEVDKQHGTTGGELAGQSVVSALSKTLSGIATYSAASGQIGGLQSLGIELDKTGHLTFSSFSLLAADITNSTGVTAFLGSATSDGFIKSAIASLNSVENTASGLLKTIGAAVANQITDIDSRITEQQTRVDLLTLNLQNKMAAADALISSMEQQYNFLTGMFQAMQTAANQYK